MQRGKIISYDFFDLLLYQYAVINYEIARFTSQKELHLFVT